MNTQTLTKQENVKTSTVYPETIVEDVYYPPQLEDEMGETAIHFLLTSEFFHLLKQFFALREDVLTAANMMVYFDEGNARKWLAPDVFVCFGVENKLRKTYKVWEEVKIFPQVVFEIASENTVENDLGKKYLDYSRLGVEEYYLLDPERSLLPSPLMAFQKNDERLVAVNVENDRVFSPLMNLEIVNTGTSFGLFNPETKEFLQAILKSE